jgi:hypothetical protein
MEKTKRAEQKARRKELRQREQDEKTEEKRVIVSSVIVVNQTIRAAISRSLDSGSVANH